MKGGRYGPRTTGITRGCNEARGEKTGCIEMWVDEASDKRRVADMRGFNSDKLVQEKTQQKRGAEHLGTKEKPRTHNRRVGKKRGVREGGKGVCRGGARGAGNLLEDREFCHSKPNAWAEDESILYRLLGTGDRRLVIYEPGCYREESLFIGSNPIREECERNYEWRGLAGSIT